MQHRDIRLGMIQAVRVAAGVFKLIRTLERNKAIRKAVLYLGGTEGLYRVGDEE
jgi:hypothetical protein